MTQIKFGILFVILSAGLLLVLNQYEVLEHQAPFMAIYMLVAYFAGRYSTRLPKG